MPIYDPITSEKFFFNQPNDFLYHQISLAFGDTSGIYRLHIVKNTTEFMHIPRILETDINGIIYIGTAAKLNQRTASLQKALSVAYNQNQWISSGHGLLQKLQSVPRFVERFGYTNFCVTALPTQTTPDEFGVVDSDHWSLERRLLKEYKEWFGEYPLFNSN